VPKNFENSGVLTPEADTTLGHIIDPKRVLPRACHPEPRCAEGSAFRLWQLPLVASPFETFCADESYPSLADAFGLDGHRIA